MMLLKPVAKFCGFQVEADEQGFGKHYSQLQPIFQEVVENVGEEWALKESFRQECEARVKKRIRKAAKVWLIHGGRSAVWTQVGNFVANQLSLPCIEFNDSNAERIDIKGRVEAMAASSRIAIAVMTAEDQTAGGRVRARQNVVHEIGLAQGCLGFDRVIIMREEGVEDFSNMDGLVYVPFQSDNVHVALPDLEKHIDSRLG
jgi:predicted nucleotide-binding protein